MDNSESSQPGSLYQAVTLLPVVRSGVADHMFGAPKGYVLNNQFHFIGVEDTRH
jgi:hypothetical protein